MSELHQPLPYLPHAGYAMVVFMRPSTYADTNRYAVYADRYGFVGHSLPASWFFAELPAGQHLFCAKGENTAALRASLAPGRTYYVEVSPRYGFFSSRVQLLAVTPRSSQWSQRYDWLAESAGYRLVDPGEVQRDVVADAISDCQEVLSRYDAAELEERTLNPNDGI
ncbi:MAG TPA: hypothetical protein VGP93_08050 [Polyangiaceae bacterium]|nr:hypothetical protein [Polyangiaceae bacterium]